VLAVRRPTLPSTHDVKETLGQQHYLCCTIHRSATYHVILSKKMRFRKKLRIGSGGYEGLAHRQYCWRQKSFAEKCVGSSVGFEGASDQHCAGVKDT
jgi:hypothetical protein